MIARFQFLLSFELAISPDHNLRPYDPTRDGFEIRVYPPYQCQVDPRSMNPNWSEPMSEIPRKLDPDPTVVGSETITINGAPALLANALQIDFFGSMVEFGL